MGYAKHMLEEIMNRGFDSVNKNICANCVGDDSLKLIIRNHGDLEKCDYCESDGIKCITVTALIYELMEGVKTEYMLAEGEVYFDKDAWEYAGTDIWYSNELISSICEEEAKIENWDIINDITSAVDYEMWCERDWHRGSPVFELTCLWNKFCKIVKERVRYFFQSVPASDDDKVGPAEILEVIAQTVIKFDMFTVVAKDSSFFRGRPHKNEECFTTETELCSPPHKNAQANRMSAEGISVFYGADNAETVIKEVANPEEPYVTVAEFNNNEELVLLDLTKSTSVEFPSVFNKSKRKYRSSLGFLRLLSKELIKPIEDLKRIEYIPTQIVAEYFRHAVEYKGKKIDGIIYNSSQDSNEKCYVLFFDYEDCLSTNREQKIKLKEGSISRRKLGEDNE